MTNEIKSGMTNDRIAMCMEKWHSYFSDAHYNSPQSKQIALMLEAQAAYLDKQMPEDARSFLHSALGEQWRETFLHAYVKTLIGSKILTQFLTQPLHGPIGCVAYLEAGTSTTENAVDALTRVVKEDDDFIPEIRFNLKTKEVTAKPHPLRAMFPTKEEMSDLRIFVGNGDSIMETVLAEVISDRQRSIIGELRDVAKANPVIASAVDSDDPEESAKNAVRRACYTVHKNTMRAPANHVIGGKCAIIAQKSVGAERKAHVHHDPCYPNGELLAWYTGPSVLDGAVVWAPLWVTVAMDEKKVPVEQEGGEIVEEARPFMKIGFRDAVVVVNPDAVVMVKIPEPKPAMPLTGEVED